MTSYAGMNALGIYIAQLSKGVWVKFPQPKVVGEEIFLFDLHAPIDYIPCGMVKAKGLC
jgi:hypothetical protein